MTLRAYDVDCDDVPDLTDPATRSARGIGAADLACPWKDLSTRGQTPPGWALSDRLVAAGCAGIIVPTLASGAMANDLDAGFWGWAPDRPHRLRVTRDHARLPRTSTSWTS